MTPRQGFCFIHGINQTQAELDSLQSRVEGLLVKNGLTDRFDERHGEWSSATLVRHVWIAKWRSLGSFIGDLEDLSLHEVRRIEAIRDIQTVIKAAWEHLVRGVGPEDMKPRLLVCAHSMGQPLGLAALDGLQVQAASIDPVTQGINHGPLVFPVPTSLLSVGGPLANDDPVTDQYFDHWGDVLPRSKPIALHEWIDVWNPLDPISSAPILGSSPYAGSRHLMFKVPGQPQLPIPFINNIAKYHSAYFDHPDIYQIAAKMLDNLGQK